MTDIPPQAPQGVESRDFDAFWEEKAKRGERKLLRVKVLGEWYNLPPRPPLKVLRTVSRIIREQGMEAEIPVDDIWDMLTVLFGENTLKKWEDAGLDDEQLENVLTWTAEQYGISEPQQPKESGASSSEQPSSGIESSSAGAM